MRRLILFTYFYMVLSVIGVFAQSRKVQNRPYIDLRPFHFGALVGTHVQDIEFKNVGPTMLTLDDGTTSERLVTVDQDRWDVGFTVGVLGELRLSENFQFRVAPTMYFGTRHFTFRNFSLPLSDGSPTEERQEMKSAYISVASDLIFAGPRFNNHRPYIMLGVNPMLNLTPKDDDYLKLKRYDAYLEAGLGCDFYLPYVKFRTELKFMYGLINSLDTEHGKHLRDKTMLQYTNSVSDARSKMIALTFYFE